MEKKPSVLCIVTVKHLTQSLSTLGLLMAKLVNGKDNLESIDKIDHGKSASKSERQKTPYQRANFLSKMAFQWVQPIASKGKSGKLTEEDLMLAETEEAEFCYNQFAQIWEKELTKEKHP